MNILLIEDEPIQQKLVSKFLAGSDLIDFKVTTADSLKEGVETAAHESVDVVLLDLGLPDSHGLDSFTGFHSNHPDLPILIMTGLDDDEIATRAIREGAQDFIRKDGIKKDTLVLAIRYALERKEVEKKILDSERRYRMLLENIPQKVFYKDTDSKYLAVNESYANSLGTTPEDMVGKSDHDLYPEDMAKKYVADDKEIMNGKEILEIEEDFSTPNGDFTVHTIKVPIKDELGKVVGILGIFWDITERVRMERELKESEEKLRSIFNGSMDGILLADPETKTFHMANPAMEEILGYSMDELMNLTLADIHPKEDLPMVIETFEKQARGDIRLASELPVLKKNGDVIYCDINSSPQIIDEKEFVLGVFRDVTKRRNADKVLREEKEKLERFSNLAIGREKKMIELKARIKELEEELNKLRTGE